MAKGQDDDQLQDEALATGAAPGKKKKLLFMLIGIVALVVLAGGGIGVWLLMAPPDDGKQAEHAVQEEEQPPIYEKLDTFTVNLADREHYLQVELALKLSDPDAQGKAKLYMPEVRDVLLRLLSSKTSEELSSQEGKDRLASEIQAQVNEVLRVKEPGKGVKGVLFNSFIIQ